MGPHVPYRLMRACNRAVKINSRLIPKPDQAASEYRLNGGRITDPEDEINDPLFSNSIKIDIRFKSFVRRLTSFDVIFHSVLNGNTSVYVDALTFFIDLTFRLCHS